MDKRRKRSAVFRNSVFAAAAVLFGLTMSVAACYSIHSPGFTAQPVKSDAIVLFLGSTGREKEADRLLDEGYAGLLIVPASRQVHAGRNSVIRVSILPLRAAAKIFRDSPDFYENTHREMLYAKTVMQGMGLRTAIMVSSPYHMERIRIIARKVFGRQADLFSYVPAPYGQRPDGVWGALAYAKLEAVEFIKICWFRLYSVLS